MRQFGRMLVIRKSKLHDTRQLAELAPEPLLDGFSLEYFQKILKSTRRPIKQLLLDQTKILGLGNIYASEALFLAQINPAAVPARLSTERAQRLHSAIQEILREAIDEGSTLRIDLAETDSSYIGTEERFWRVYERAGEPCVRCGANIRRIVQGNRSSYYCPKCQRR
jgi:formamidopyrimidine-DNA glycosylase